MKLTTFLLLAVCLQISAKGVSQSITLSEKNVPLKKVLREVSRQAGISIVYDEGLLANTNPVTVEASKASVQEVMDLCLRNQPVFYTIDGQRLILQSMPASSWHAADTSVMVRGQVTDEKGLAIPGASIRVKGGNQGTATDVNGRFSLKVPTASGQLVVTVVGYNQQTVNMSSNVLVQLQASETSLNETVVVGYGVQKKSVVTGAISSVKASDLESQPITRLESALQGRTSGVTVAQSSGQPGSGSSVRVRGITTFNNNDPLWVIDGVVVDNGGIGYLNQYDIESIEVLKDAASQAIYGARAAAGVILVTTKKGKEGKMQVNYNGYYGTSAPARKLKLLDATQYGTLLNEASAAAGYALPFSDPRTLGKGTDWQSEIFNNSAIRQNHEVSISGGNARSTFFSSFGYLDQEGIVASPISHYKRFNVRLNSTHKLASWLTFAENVGYAYDRALGIGNTNSEFGGPLSSAINLDPTTPAVVTDPNVINSDKYTKNLGVRLNSKGQPYGISDLVQNEMSNPLAYIVNNMGNYNWSHNIVGNTYLEAEPIKGLRLRSTIGAKIAFWGGESFTPIYYYNTTNKNARTAFNRSMNTGFNWNVENTIAYTHTIGDHNFTILAGQGAYLDNRSKSLSNTFQDLQVDNFWDASEKFKVAQTSRSTDGGEGVDHRIASLFGRLNYNYKEKYLLEGVVRRDGSSRFGPNNKYGTFPSISAGWVASKEDFFPKTEIIDFLKFRGGYGVVGNDNIGDFGYLSTIGSGRNYTFGTGDIPSIGYSPDAPSNPDLRWESTAQTNVGFEATLFRNFTVSFDWYKKKTKDILQNPRIPAYVGAISNPPANVADMQNTGEELELGYHAKVGELNIGLNGNVSYTQNKITYVGRGLAYLDGGVGFQSTSYPITRKAVGQPIDEFYGFVTQGIFQNQHEVDNYVNKAGDKIQPNAVPGDFRYKDVNGDGKIDGDDRDFIGNPTPSWTYGFNVNLSYKGFDLGLFGQGASGNKIFQGLRRLDLANANWQTKALGRWTGEGSTNAYPRLTLLDNNHNFTNPSAFYLEDGAYLRLKTVQLGYTLPYNISHKAGISRARIYVMSENLFTFTKYTGYDPEIGGGTMSIDRGIYPQARSFLLGLNVTFQ